MAQISLLLPTDTDFLSDFLNGVDDFEIESFSSTSIVVDSVEDGTLSDRYQFSGTFGGTEEAVTGTVTGLELFIRDPDFGNDLVLDIVATGLSADAATVEDVFEDNNSGGLLSILLAGSDAITGNVADDRITGAAGNDTIDGAGGDDTLLGGSGDDTLTGGAGADSFFIEATGGTKTISDFDADEGDELFVAGFGFDSAAAVIAAATQTGADVTLQADADTRVVLQNTTLADLDEDAIRVNQIVEASDDVDFAGDFLGDEFSAITLDNVSPLQITLDAVSDVDDDERFVLNGTFTIDGDDRPEGTVTSFQTFADGDEDDIGVVGIGTDIDAATLVAALEARDSDQVRELLFGDGVDFDGTEGDDVFEADAGDDSLVGGGGDDILSGGDGDDTLSGGPGADVLSGGAGADEFVDTAADHNGNTITDLEAGDSLRILGTVLDGTSVVVADAATDTITIDVDGDGTTEVTLNSGTDVDALSFNVTTDGTDTVIDAIEASEAMENFTLQLLHAADQEAGLAAVDDAVNFSAVLETLADGYDNTIRISSGDIFIAGAFFDASDVIYGESGIGDILINNALGWDAVTIGNHEFDAGPGQLSTLIRPDSDITGPGIGSGGYEGAAFPYLSANLEFDGTPLEDLVVAGGQAAQPNVITSSTVVDVNGESIGVVGATTPTLEDIASTGDVTVLPSNDDLDELAALIQQQVDALTDQGIDKIILSSHFQQLQVERDIAARLDDVDIVIGGGSNTILANSDDPLRAGDGADGPYPEEIDSDGETVYLVNTDGNYRYVGQLVATFDDNGVITEIGDDSGAFATDDAGVAALLGDDVDAADVADPVVVEVTDAIQAETGVLDGNTFGFTDVFLDGRRSEVRSEETNLGNLSADANLAAGQQALANDADLFDDPDLPLISLKNGGGIRAQIGEAVVPAGSVTGEVEFLPPAANPSAEPPKEEGEISQLDIQTALAFNNGLTMLRLTPEQLKIFLEDAVAGVAPDSTPGSFAQVGGFAFSFDPTLQAQELDPETNAITTAGERVQTIRLINEDGSLGTFIVDDGAVVEGATDVRVVTLNFLADGDLLSGFVEADADFANRVDLIGEDENQNGVLDAGEDLNGNGVLDGPVDLGDEGGVASFAESGSEQDAFAEFLSANHGTRDTAFDVEETAPEDDLRVQNLSVRDEDLTDIDAPDQAYELQVLGTFSTGVYDDSAAEIVAYNRDPENPLLFVVNGAESRIDIIDISNVNDPVLQGSIDLEGEAVDGFTYGGVNSVAVSGTLLAAAVEHDDGNLDGAVYFYDLSGDTPTFIRAVSVGVMPDNVAFTPDGTKVLTADEGEPVSFPGAADDPPGSISIIDISNGVETATSTTLDFEGFSVAELAADGVRFFPNAADDSFNIQYFGETLEVIGADLANPVAVVDAAVAENLYLNIHTNDFNGGEIRGQTTLVNDGRTDGVGTVEVSISLSGDQEVPPVTTDASGSGTIVFDVAADGSVTYDFVLRVDGIAVEDLFPAGGVMTPIHLHNAPAGANGGIVVDVAGDAGFDQTTGFDEADAVSVTSTDLEPEYIAVSPDSTQAFVTLQENNAVAVVDLTTNTITDVLPLGSLDHSVEGNGIDASDRDGAINIQNWPVQGLFMPDTIVSYETGGETFYVTANEGDGREYEVGDVTVTDEDRLDDLTLDPTVFPDAADLQADEALGRLIVSTIDGDTDGDGDLDEIFSFGTRSFTIWNSDGEIVFDSGDDFEQITAELFPNDFNSTNDENDSFDSRSDAKGPEPEVVEIGQIGDQIFAFIGLERSGGIVSYNVTDPENAFFVDFINPRDFTVEAELADGSTNPAVGDLGPEGFEFISAEDSPIGVPLLAVASEVSGTTTLIQLLNDPIQIGEIQGAGHFSDFEGEVVRTTGVITAVDNNGFYLQDPDGDGDDATSDGIFVFTGFGNVEDDDGNALEVGNLIDITAEVDERFPGGQSSGNLSTTQLTSVSEIVVLEAAAAVVPTPVVIGESGRVPPTETIDDDGLTSFDPTTDGIDFYEAVEGMLVTVEDAVAVTGTNRFGEIFTVPNDGAFATNLNDRGGVTISPDDFNPERIQIDTDSTVSPFSIPDVDTGAFLGDVTGVVSYNFGNFEVIPTVDFTDQVVASDIEREITEIEGNGASLTIASYNVLNLDPVVEDVALVDDQDEDEIDDDVGEGRFAQIAEDIVFNLDAPDIIALQEVQDNDGAEISDVVSASDTYQLLIDEIVAAGGPEYEFIDNPGLLPIPDAENTERPTGGQPGGNIRVGYLYNPDEVTLVPDSVVPLVDASETDNPDSAFFEGRIPLAAQFIHNGDVYTVVNAHLSSKSGSTPLFGAEQPSVNGGEDERFAQAQLINDFVDDVLEDDEGANIIVLGDLNEFQFEEPLEVLEGVRGGTFENQTVGGDQVLWNLTEQLDPLDRYTFNFQGNAQSLDHILVSDNLFDGFRDELPEEFFGIDAVGLNTEFLETDSRASDHDPLVASLTAGGDFGTDDDDVIEGTDDTDTLIGLDGDDILISGGGADVLVGGDGADEFADTAAGHDGNRITDLEAGDSLRIIGTQLTEASLVVTDTDTGEIFVDVEGDGTAEVVLTVDTNLNQLDFTVSLDGADTVVDIVDAPFTLQLLHAGDQEAGLAAITDAVNFSAVLETLADGYDNTIRISSGDIFIAGAFFDASAAIYGESGIGDILINNALGWDAVTIGNHEFDAGPGQLSTLIRPDSDITGPGIGSGGYEGAAFPYLSANLEFDGTPLEDLVVAGGQPAQPNVITSSTVVDVNGESIGVVGATTPTLEDIASTGDVTVLPSNDDLDELAALIQQQVDALTAQGIDKIILSSHFQQLQVEREIAARLDDVDIVIGGGSNTILANSDDPLRAGDEAAGPYPEEIDSDGETVYLVNTDGNYRYVGQLVATFDDNGVITEIGDDSGAFATDDAGVAALLGEDVDAADVADPVVVEVTDAIQAETGVLDGNTFGFTDVFLDGRRSEVRSEETNLGNLSADANLAAGQQALENDADLFDDPDLPLISLKNGGGIRAQIGEAVVPAGSVTGEVEFLPPQANPNAEPPKEEGEISQLDIQTALAFNNGLTMLRLTPEQLKIFLEDAVAGVAPDSTPGSFAQVGGFAFSFDPTLQAQELDPETNAITTAGERVQTIRLINEDGSLGALLVQDGEVVEGATDVRVMTLNFLANGDLLSGFVEADADFANRVDLIGEDENQNGVLDAGEDLNGNGVLDGPVDLGDEGGVASFAESGSEQDAFAEFLAEVHGTRDTAFDVEETAPEDDFRVQNLTERPDALRDDAPVRVDTGDSGATVSATDATEESTETADDVVEASVQGLGVSDDELEEVSDGLDTFLAGVPTGTSVRVQTLTLSGQSGTGTVQVGEAAEDGRTDAVVVDTRGLAQGTEIQVNNVEFVSAVGGGTFRGGTGNQTFVGSNSVDNANLGPGDDSLSGGGGDDVIGSGAGNDTLSGGAGADTLTGGEGADEFRDTAANHNGNTITDLEAGDSLRIVGTTLTDQSVLAVDQATDQITVDVDGDGTAEVTLNSGTPVERLTFEAAVVGNDTVVTIGENFTLQLLHAGDQEAGLAAVTDAVNFSAVLETLADGFDNTIRISSGDIFIAGAFFDASSSIYGESGIGDILINNALGWDAVTIGNHEFDAGPGQLSTLIRPNSDITGPGIGSGGYEGAAFPYLSANLEFDGTPLEDLVVAGGQAAQPNVITSSTVVDVNGESIGVVGATTPTLEDIASTGDVTVLPSNDDLDELAALIQQQVDALTAQGIDKIILSSHFQQLQVERDIAARLDDVDIVIGGGSNTILANDDDPLRAGDEAAGPYPEEIDSDGETVYLVNTDGNYRYVGQLVATFDDNGVITAIGDESGAFATDDAGVAAVLGDDVTAAQAADPVVVAVTDAIQAETGVLDGNTFGFTDVYLDGRRSEVRSEETNLGNLSADANLAAGQQALENDADLFDDPDLPLISLKNGGGIRAQIGEAVVPAGSVTGEVEFLPPAANPSAEPPKEEGEISQLDIQTALAFNNGLTMLRLTPEQLKIFLEDSVAGVAPDSTPGSFAQVGGFAFSFDPTRQAQETDPETNAITTAGERVQTIRLINEDGSLGTVLVENGEVVEGATDVRVVTLNFLADGDLLSGFVEADADFANRVDLIGEDENQNGVLDAGEDLNGNGVLDGPVDLGDNGGVASFAESGSEQDAFAEFLSANHGTRDTAFDVEETAPEDDLRVQNLSVREDSLADGADAETPGREATADADGSVLVGGDNADTLSGGESGDAILGFGGNDILDAGAGADTVAGGAGDDTISAGDGRDFISGGDGNDVIQAGSGDDLITGGDGADTFVFVDGLSGRSTILDAEESDLFQLAANLNGSGIDSFDDLDFVETAFGANLTLGEGDDALTIVIRGIGLDDLSADTVLIA